jgi:hypothetical protein
VARRGHDARIDRVSLAHVGVLRAAVNHSNQNWSPRFEVGVHVHRDRAAGVAMVGANAVERATSANEIGACRRDHSVHVPIGRGRELDLPGETNVPRRVGPIVRAKPDDAQEHIHRRAGGEHLDRGRDVHERRLTRERKRVREDAHGHGEIGRFHRSVAFNVQERDVARRVHACREVRFRHRHARGGARRIRKGAGRESYAVYIELSSVRRDLAAGLGHRELDPLGDRGFRGLALIANAVDAMGGRDGHVRRDERRRASGALGYDVQVSDGGICRVGRRGSAAPVDGARGSVDGLADLTSPLI